jgi:hypothetical protein
MSFPAKVFQDKDAKRDQQLGRLARGFEGIEKGNLDLQSFTRLFLEMASKLRPSFAEGLLTLGCLNLQASAVTIASGAIQVTSSNHLVDTEGAAGTDDLDNLVGGEDGDIVILSTVVSTRDVVVRHIGAGTGNIRLNGVADFTLDNLADTVALLKKGSLWVQFGCGNNA